MGDLEPLLVALRTRPRPRPGRRRSRRGVRCDAEEVIVVSSSQQAIDLVARVLIDPGDPVWIEEPEYLGARIDVNGTLMPGILQ